MLPFSCAAELVFLWLAAGQDVDLRVQANSNQGKRQRASGLAPAGINPAAHRSSMAATSVEDDSQHGVVTTFPAKSSVAPEQGFARRLIVHGQVWRLQALLLRGERLH